MPSGNTTTIRVQLETRDRLNALAAQRGESASQVVAVLVDQASEEMLLAEAEAGFEKLAGDATALAAYRSGAQEIESGFDAPAPEW